MGITSIKSYDDYRVLLKDLFDQKRQSDPTFSLRALSKNIGLKSTGFFTLVLSGKRNITDSTARRLAKEFHFSEEDSNFFLALVNYNQAKPSEKHHYAEELFRLSHDKANPLLEAQFSYMTKWYFVAIREMIGNIDFKSDPEWISKNLLPNIPVDEVKSAIKELLSLGLIKKSPNGKLDQTLKTIVNNPTTASLLASEFHRQMMLRASEALFSVDREFREVSSTTICLTEEGFKMLRKWAQELVKKSLDLSERERETTAVYQINLQLFPLTKVKK